MKSAVPIALAAHYLQDCTTLAIGVTITRTDFAVYGLTSSDKSEAIAGVTYTPGLQVKSIDISAGLAVDNLELRILDDTSLVTRPDALGGVWRNADFEIFEYNYLAPSDGVNPMLAGKFGEVTLDNGQILIELRGLQQILQQSVGSVSSKTCRARLGDVMCTKNLASYTVSGTLDSAVNKQVIGDSTRAEASDWFGEGLFTFTSGVCAGLSQKIKAYEGGLFTLMLPMIMQPAVGDTYTATAGCRKRLPEDCFSKFNNVLNFQGEYHLPGMDALTKPVGT